MTDLIEPNDADYVAPIVSLEHDIGLANARTRLARLETLDEELHHDTTENERAREVSLRSLKRDINQGREQIARQEDRRPAQRSG